MPEDTISIASPRSQQDDPPKYETKDPKGMKTVNSGDIKASITSRKPGELSPELERKVSHAIRARILHLAHYKTSSLNSEGRIVRKKKPISKINDAIMLPEKLLFPELKELLHSRMELKMADLGLKSLEGMRGAIILRGKGTVVVEVVDEHSWHSGRIFLDGAEGYTLEYGVVKVSGGSNAGATEDKGCCVLQ